MSKPLNLTELASHVDGMTDALAAWDERMPLDAMKSENWFELLAVANAAMEGKVFGLGGYFSAPGGDGISVILGGLRASSTRGSRGACQNWLTAAKRRIEAFDRGEHPHPTGSAGHPPRKGEGEGGATA